jgi:Ca2+-binding RTX toxin-like protein
MPLRPPYPRTAALSAAFLALVGAAFAASPASAGVDDSRWRLFLKVSNDIRNTTVAGYPQVTIGVRGNTFKTNWYCWRDSEAGYTLGDNAPIAPKASGVITSDVDLRGNGNCGAAYNGWRDVQLMIKEAPDADWVAPEGQENFRLAFGNETDSSIGRQSGNDRCQPGQRGNNCFVVIGMPNTWWTRPVGTGLFCMVTSTFDQNPGSNDVQRRSVMKISVRDDAQCNVPRASRYWPRENGTPSTEGFPTFGPVQSARLASTGQSSNQAAPDPAPDPGAKVNLVPNVQAVLSESALLCAWGIKDFSKAPQRCQNAGSDSSAWDLTGLTIPAAIPPDMRPPRFRVTDASTSANAGAVVCTTSVNVAAGGAPATASCNQTTTWGHQESSKDSLSKKFGTKSSIGSEWKYAVDTIIFGEADKTVKTQLETSYEQQWGFEKQYTSTTQVQTAVGISTPAAPGRTTVLRVVKTDLSHAYNFEADLMFGVDGKSETVGSPAPAALGMSPSTTQQCVATAVGGDSVTGSMMWIAKQRVDSGTGAENTLLDDINKSYSVGGRRCPGFPDGFASLAAVRGPGSGTYSSTGEGSEPILDPDGKPQYTADGVPRYVQTHGIGLTACVYSVPFPPTSRSMTMHARAHQTGTACVANVGPDANVNVASPGTLLQGTAGFDRMTATPAADLVMPGSGDDVVVGGPGPLDVVDPSPGDDRIGGGGGADHLSGGPGNDAIDAGPGPFWSLGGPGNDRISQRGSEGYIWGGPGNDVIRTDSVRGGISGGAGRDVFQVTGSTAGAVFDGGPGNDRYEVGPGRGCAAIFERPGGGVDTVVTSRCLAESPNLETITLAGTAPLILRTADGRQTLTGNDADNVLDGGIGRDVMDGAIGNDVIHLGGDSYDTATGGPGADRFIPGGTASTGYHTGLAPNARSHRITDFSTAEGDRIVLRAASFGPEVRRLRQKWSIVSSVHPAATVPAPTLLHDPRTGLIAFDRDGSGIRSPRVVAMVPRGTVIGPTMFEIR